MVAVPGENSIIIILKILTDETNRLVYDFIWLAYHIRFLR